MCDAHHENQRRGRINQRHDVPGVERCGDGSQRTFCAQFEQAIFRGYPIRSASSVANRERNCCSHEAADKDGASNELNQAEIESLVKDSTYEDRSNRRLIKVVIASMLLLLLSRGQLWPPALGTRAIQRVTRRQLSDTMSASYVTRRRALLG